MTKAERNKYRGTLIRWWQELLEKHDPVAFATAPSDSANPRITKHMFSCSFKRGTRHFAFQTVEARDRFVRCIDGAEVCDNPFPLPRRPVMSDADENEHLPRPSKAPCGSCPYRTDVPSGVWDREEYEKLPGYDGSTLDQILAGNTQLFLCHQNDRHLCAGWAACHDTDHLAALRFHLVHPSTYGYKSPIPVFSSGKEAAEHGMRDIDNPSPEARVLIDKLDRRIGNRDASLQD